MRRQEQIDAVAAFYNDVDTTRPPSITDRERIKAINHLFERKTSDRFLDIGCYDGTKTTYIAEIVSAKEVYGIDFLEDRLAMASELGIKTVHVDLNQPKQIPFVSASFDLIFIGDVIEHVFSPDHLLQEVARLLKPGGYTIITTPNLASWRNRLVLLFGWQPFMTEVSTSLRVGNPLAPIGKPSGHIRVFVPRALTQLAAEYSLITEVIAGINGNSPGGGLYTRAARQVDQVISRISPKLCDELVVKLRKHS